MGKMTRYTYHGTRVPWWCPVAVLEGMEDSRQGFSVRDNLYRRELAPVRWWLWRVGWYKERLG